MGLNEFFELSVGCEFSADQAQRLNKALSKVRLEDIPPEKRPLVADYLHKRNPVAGGRAEHLRRPWCIASGSAGGAMNLCASLPGWTINELLPLLRDSHASELGTSFHSRNKA